MANPLPNFPDVWQVRLRWAASTLKAENVFYVATPLTSAAAIMTALNAAVIANMWAYTSTDVHVDHVLLTRLDQTSPSVQTPVSGANWAGTLATGAELYVAPTVVVTIVPSIRGRGRKGRNFLPFPAEAVVQNGSLTGATKTALDTAWGGWIGRLSAQQLTLSVVGIGDSEKLPVPRPPSRSVATAVSVHASLGNQRMRQGRIYV